MRGHVRKRGTWEYILELGDRPTQRCTACNRRHWVERTRLKVCIACSGSLVDRIERKQQSRSGFRTKKDAETALNEALSALCQGTYVEPAKLTVEEFLRDEWLPAIKSTIRESTYLSYKGHVERHIIPLLGTVRLQQLSGSPVNSFYAKLLTEVPGGEKQRENSKSSQQAGATKVAATKPALPKKKLSKTTVHHIHGTLHKALKDAVRWDRLPRNPIEAANPPRRSSGMAEEMQAWTSVELKQFLSGVGPSRLYPLWLLLAATGMRRGEVVGLRWKDVDLKAGRLAVRQTLICVGYETRVSEPKTRKGRRSVALDPVTVATLKRWRRDQSKERLAWGPAWTDTGYVFTREDGQPHHPDRVSKLFEDAVAASKLPRIRLHDLRHTHATLALAAGIHPKVVSERLGHANVSITLDTYSHAIPAMAEEAATRIAAFVHPE